MPKRKLKEEYLSKTKYILILSHEVQEAIPEIKELCWKMDQLPNTTTDEYKRHTVYAALVKKYPDMKRKDISMAIEIAVRELSEE